MNIVDTSFFVRDISIPNSGSPRVTSMINDYIKKYEPECLIKILGYSLYTLFVADASSQRMTKLLTGSDYISIHGNSSNWRGLVYGDRESLIAYYIYYKIMEDNATKTTGLGEEVESSDKGKSISPARKMVKAWNNFSNDATQLLMFLWSSQSTYSEVSFKHLHRQFDLLRPINTLF